MAVAKGDREARGYGTPHRRMRDAWARRVATGQVACVRCGDLIRPWLEPWDLGHVDGDRSRYAGPEHARCNRATKGRRWFRELAPAEAEPERDGLPASDDRWRVSWLKGLRRVPKDATWPRLMTVPHPRAVGSLGPEFIRWAEREGIERKPLRWFQKLAATRMLEVDAAGDLVWDAMVLSLARQLGKSWLLAELCMWRIQQGDRFGEPQLVMHTGKDLKICREVQLHARNHAKSQPGIYKVREANGQEEIEFRADHSRWMLIAKGSPYGFGVSMGVVDEAWYVETAYVDDGLVPAMIERRQTQLLLVSTAHREAKDLMLNRRKVALAQLESGDGDLLVEWSAPPGAAVDDRAAWRAASPHWTVKRERDVERALEAMYLGETDVDENDPEQAFRSQRLNQWPPKRSAPFGSVEPLLPAGLWASLVEPSYLQDDVPVFVGLEDRFGKGSAVAAVAVLDDGRLEVDGWLCDDWNTAIAYAQRIAGQRRICELHVGANLLSRFPVDGLPSPRPAGSMEIRAGLSVFRDLAAGGQLVHDETTDDLDQALAAARVKEQASGLQLVGGPKDHLVKAAVWAAMAAHRPARVYAVR